MEKASQSFGIREAGQLLRLARMLAGFTSAKAAAIHFGWSEPLMRAHESATRRIGLKDAEKYASAFGISGDAFRSGDAARAEMERLRESSPFAADEIPVGRSHVAVGARLKLARKVRGFVSSYDFGSAFGFVPSTLASHEAGNNPVNERMMEAYAEALTLSPSWLARGDFPSGLGEAADRLIGSVKSLAEIDPAYLARIAEAAPPPDFDKVKELLSASKMRRAPGSSEEDEIYEVEPASIVQALGAARRLRTWKLPKGLLQTLFDASPSETVIVALDRPIEGMAQGDRVFVDTSCRDWTAAGEFAFCGADGRVFLARHSDGSATSGGVLIGRVVGRLLRERV